MTAGRFRWAHPFRLVRCCQRPYFWSGHDNHRYRHLRHRELLRCGPENIPDRRNRTRPDGRRLAYSQGANPNFSSASIGASVFSLGQSIDFYSAAGQFTVNLAASAKNGPTWVTHAGAAAESTRNFGGVGDLNEVDGPLLPAASINGTYTLAANGYGSMTFAEGFGDVAVLDVYAVDPTLNILHPNNTTDTAAEGLFSSPKWTRILWALEPGIFRRRIHPCSPISKARMPLERRADPVPLMDLSSIMEARPTSRQVLSLEQPR